jgi:hypothetical protein
MRASEGASAYANEKLHGNGRIEGEFVRNEGIPIASKLSKKGLERTKKRLISII